MACPNYEAIVRQLKDQHPEAWRNAHTGNAHTEDFVRIVAATLNQMDPAVGLNGKRGNPNDISDDALNILDPIDGPGRTPDGRRCWVVDFIAQAGSPQASVTWQPFSNPQDSSGAWVLPSTQPNPPQPQPPVVVQPPGREEALDEMRWLDGYYAAPEGLQRPNGLSLNGKPDFEGIAAWYLDLYQRERMAGKTRADARAVYVSAIRHTDEWKRKHPGETP